MATNLYPGGRRHIATPRVDSRLAERLIAQALQPPERIAQSEGEAAANMGTRLVNAWLGKQLLDKQAEREAAAGDTVAKALSAAKPWRTPDAVEAGPGPNMPALKPGDAFPGTGGPDAMIAALTQNPDTAPIAMKYALQKQMSADQLANAIAKLRESEKVHMQGRGDPEYLGKVAAAKREPVPDAANRAGAIAKARLPAQKELAESQARAKSEQESGQTERIIARLQKEDPNLSYRDALTIAKYAPRTDTNSLRRERLALDAAKEDPDWGLDQNATLEKWRKKYNLAPMVGSSGNAAPAAGAVVGGYRFKGGDPNNKSNWEAVK